MKRRTTTIAAITAVALLGAGTATAVAVADDDASASTSSASRSSVRVEDDGAGDARENAAEAKGAKVRAEEAVAAALKHTPGTATGADLDSDDGRLVWEVDVIGGGDTWHHVDVDPGTGKVLGSHTEKDDGDAARVLAALKKAPTSAGDAARAAAAKGTVTSVDADDDGSVTAWEAETTSADGKQRDWLVDLRSGAVTVDHSADHPADDEGDDGDDD